jgi:serine protease Do
MTQALFSNRNCQVSLFLLCLCVFIPPGFTSTEDVFKQYQDRLLQIRIVDNTTNSKSTIGSGFFIDENGTIATNYHVISKHVFKPKQYRVEYVTHDGEVHDADLLHIDVIHDLALLSGDAVDTPFLKISDQLLDKGVRIYTLGNPLDLGMTIVEGTYNGITQDTMHERILLSGALNPGMSGGPSVIEDGSVIGINVATAGNSIGFLVPQKFLAQLAQDAKNIKTKNFMAVIGEQLQQNQDKYLKELSDKPFPVKKLGAYTVPAKLADFLNCWGDSRDDSSPYRKSNDYCATKNDIYINSNLSTGKIRYTHIHFTDKKMGKFRFYNLIGSYFGNPSTSLSTNQDDFTEYNCKTDYISQHEITFKTAFCLRRYKKFDGLFDMVLTAASLNEDDKSLVTTLVLSGVSYENAVRFSKHYLGSFKWKRP